MITRLGMCSSSGQRQEKVCFLRYLKTTFIKKSGVSRASCAQWSLGFFKAVLVRARVAHSLLSWVGYLGKSKGRKPYEPANRFQDGGLSSDCLPKNALMAYQTTKGHDALTDA